MLPLLVKAFPKTFFPRGLSCRPLRVGIFGDLDAVLPGEIDRRRLKHYLGIYTAQPGYLLELKEGATRIDLNGRQAGRVGAKEAASAAARLQVPQAQKIKPDLRAAATRTSCPVSAPIALGLADVAGAVGRKKAAQAEHRQVIVVLKKKKTLGEMSSKDTKTKRFERDAQLRSSNRGRLNPQIGTVH
jgi:sRNA-binding protein